MNTNKIMSFIKTYRKLIITLLPFVVGGIYYLITKDVETAKQVIKLTTQLLNTLFLFDADASADLDLINN